ncbi:MAG: hypothetical protein ABJE66_30430 [Deltaproteobacteria bacterium]
MAHLPARFPLSEADLADWSVYADELMREGDRVGELIAHDLATPAQPSDDELKRFAAITQSCWRARTTLDAGWALGHVRELVVWGVSRRLMHRIATDPIDDGTLARLHDVLRTPTLARLETITIATAWETKPPLLRRALSALPPSCGSARVMGRLLERPHTMLDLLPAHITRLAVHVRTLHDTPRLVDDRFAEIEIPRIEERDLPAIERALGTSSRVRIVVSQYDRHIDERIALRAGPGFLQTKPRRAVALGDPTLCALQRHFGIVPIRAQLAKALPEQFWVSAHQGFIVAGPDLGSTLMRRGDVWTVRGEELESYPIALRGSVLAPGQVAPVHDGDVIKVDGIEAIFCTHDLAVRFLSI